MKKLRILLIAILGFIFTNSFFCVQAQSPEASEFDELIGKVEACVELSGLTKGFSKEPISQSYHVGAAVKYKISLQVSSRCIYVMSKGNMDVEKLYQQYFEKGNTDTLKSNHTIVVDLCFSDKSNPSIKSISNIPSSIEESMANLILETVKKKPTGEDIASKPFLLRECVEGILQQYNF